MRKDKGDYMTINDMIDTGIVLEGNFEIRMWSDDGNYHEYYKVIHSKNQYITDKEYKDFRDMEIKYIFPEDMYDEVSEDYVPCIVIEMQV